MKVTEMRGQDGHLAAAVDCNGGLTEMVSRKAIIELEQPLVDEYSPSAPINKQINLPENDRAIFEQNERIASDITVVIPVYNTDPEQLNECICSVLGQTVRPREILLIDDATTLTQTRAYLNGLQNLLGVRLVRNSRNMSLGPTMNRALRMCKTPFVLKLDSDDVARPELIEKLATFVTKNRNVDVVGCQFQSFGQTSMVTDHPQRVTRDYVVKSNGYWFINHTGVLLNRESVLAVNGYRRRRGLSEDYELWVRMMLGGFRRFYNLPEVLLDYRDLATGLHCNPRKRLNRAMLILLKTLMRTCPNF